MALGFVVVVVVSSLNEFTVASNCAQSALCDDPLPRSSHILTLTGSSF